VAYWKVLTHDWRPPVQGGNAICDGKLPCELPKTHLDTSDAECAAGWNCCATLAQAAKIGGLWPNGRPSLGLLVEPGLDAITRGDKTRASTMQLVRQATADEWRSAITEMSAAFGKHQDTMTTAQLAWHHALERPKYNEGIVRKSLDIAIKTRGLAWKLQSFSSAWNAWAAWAAWAARAAWDAWAALTVQYASLSGWYTKPAGLLTDGIICAYEHGLAIALPVSKDTLSYAMIERK